MILTTYLDESGTHDSSAISVMAGYVASSAQWELFNSEWTSLVRKSEVKHIHAVDLFKRTKQFKNWKAGDVNSLAISLDNVIAKHLPMGFAVIVRGDDYEMIYGNSPHPKKTPKDSKYGVCFRACLTFVPSFIASELKLTEQKSLAQQTTINFVLEDGHKNVGDARRLFCLYKADVLPEWKNLIGAMGVSKKDSPGTQAADFLAYAVYRAESLEHGHEASDVERSTYVADMSLIDNARQRQASQQKGPVLFRIPISQQILRSLKDELFAIAAERQLSHVARSTS